MECNKGEAVRARRIASNQTDLSQIADSLEEDCQIGFLRHSPRCHMRYVTLRSNELFTRLCNLYMDQFRASYPSFKSTIKAIDVPVEAPKGTTQLQYAVACYISSFFWDLYVSIRKSVFKLSHTALLQHYNSEQYHVSERYDPFLHHLLSVIKPTHLFGTIEDVLYIPLLSNDIDFTNTCNPFSINNFMLDEALVQGLLDCMDDEDSKWRTVKLSHETLGRPFWLLDWRLDQAFAWFPQERNFAKEDLIAAQILGIPCTPRLGPRDVDDWQFFPGYFLPTDIILTDYRRATTRRFYGAAEYRTISHRQWCPEQTIIEVCEPVSSKRRQPEPTSTSSGESGNWKLTLAVTTDTQQQQQPPSPPPLVSFCQYQLIDWCYHGVVVFDLGVHAQARALTSFICSVPY
ncbi:hypothetical protein V6N13_064035 [Hibiscus sabdariffa]|uniref:Uncharacterized protein n=1 Tax=Hibiscus sabdariffa TaxID=183260 RepID=A0ABR2R1X2_9ROSI